MMRPVGGKGVDEVAAFGAAEVATRDGPAVSYRAILCGGMINVLSACVIININSHMLNTAKKYLRNLRDVHYCHSKRNAIEKDWRNRFHKIYKLHPEYQTPCPPELERRHTAYWSRFGSFGMDTLRVCHNIAGQADHRIVPEVLQTAILERCLNPVPLSPFLTHKGYYETIYGSIFPHVYLQRMEGLLVEPNLHPIPESALPGLLESLPYPVVFKPSVDSSGGRGLRFPRNTTELTTLLDSGPNFVIQETLVQHPFFHAYNPVGLNTLRVYVYRSVRDESYHALNVAARFGRGGSLDNETAGGIVALIGREGRMGGYAVDKYGQKFFTHPDSGQSVDNSVQVPNYPALLESAKRLAASIPLLRLIGFDFCLQPDLTWRAIEINALGSTIRFAQYHGEAFYGPFTDEVVDHCLRHPHRDRVTLVIY
jgi:hypothetical protein